MKRYLIGLALVIAILISAVAYARHRHSSQHSMQYITIQIWSQSVTQDGVTATYHNVDKLAAFKADGNWEEVTDLTDNQRQIIADRLRVMLKDWVAGQGLK